MPPVNPSPAEAPTKPKLTLETPLPVVIRLAERERAGLEKLRLFSVRDLLYHFPARYGDVAEVRLVSSLADGEVVTVYGTLGSMKTGKTFRSRVPQATGQIADESGTLRLAWFSQPYIAKMFPSDTQVKVIGKVTVRDGRRSMVNPEIERVSALPSATGDSLFGERAPEAEAVLFPVYPETRGVSSRWLYHAIQKILASLPDEAFADPIPEPVSTRLSLPTLRTALFWIHAPKKQAQALAARKRFAFEEMFLVQVGHQRARREIEAEPAYRVVVNESALANFVSRFPFKPTDSQTEASREIFADLGSGKPMSRLLEGDVGSGKTFVAALAAHAVVSTAPEGAPSARLEVAYMAPTEILARQHFDSFVSYFRHLGVPVGFISGTGCLKFPSKSNPNEPTKVSRTQFLKWVANGELPIVVGTHALIQKSVKFKRLGLVIIDEQHRFGMRQRSALAKKEGRAPHLLSMTATPIPRTLALTAYGNLDLTLVRERPEGRGEIVTKIMGATHRRAAYEAMRAELAAGRQAFVICPRIDEADPDNEMALQAASAKSEAKRLAEEVFPAFEVALLHGKLKPAEKDEAMRQFVANEAQILVATSVVEVGVNIPNATVMLIEGAERFGLAQLHQLRGRIARSRHRALCLLATESRGETTMARLNAMTKNADGFALAEQDLANRGPGELIGGRQWGLSDLAMEALKNLPLVDAARKEAAALVATDPKLSSHPTLATTLTRRGEVHLE